MSAATPPPPPPPSRAPLPATYPHTALHAAVQEVIHSLPIHFRSDTHISGVMATDLHTLNTVLGATIEDQVVKTMNLLRRAWDPTGHYPLHHFARQSQTFPDVLLRRADGTDILLGIELKGWYLLAKEREPSLRFQVTPAACAPPDLIVVFPWVLSNVISGSPILFEPFVESARHAAELRNHHWVHVRQASGNRQITSPQAASPYPSKSDQIADQPAQDSGGNFGRLARTGVMDGYLKKIEGLSLCGIGVQHWREFLSAFRDGRNDKEVRAALARLRSRVESHAGDLGAAARSALVILDELASLLRLDN